eukprot:202766_1
MGIGFGIGIGVGYMLRYLTTKKRPSKEQTYTRLSEELTMEYAFVEQPPMREKPPDEDTKVSDHELDESVSSLSLGWLPTPSPQNTPSLQPQPSNIKTIFPNRFENITKEESIQFLIDMKAIVPVYVPKNEQDRWTLSQQTLTQFTDLHTVDDSHKDDPDYTEMTCFVLQNFEKTFDIKECEMKAFEEVIVWAVEMCDDIYILNLNSSSTDAIFLGRLFKVLIQRNNTDVRFG